MWHPQSAFHRSTPWAHDQALTRTRASWVGGRSVEEVDEARDVDAAPGGTEREGVGDVLLGAGVVVAERLAVGGGRHHPLVAARAASRMSALVGRAKARAWASAPSYTTRSTVRSGVLRVAPPVGPARVEGAGASTGPARGRTGRQASPSAPSGRTASIWPGARIVNRIPSSASTSSTASLTAVSGSHIPAGAATEPVHEVHDPPAHLGAQVVLVAQREDGVAVGLRDGPPRRGVGGEDRAVHVRVVRLEPGQQRGPDVEGQVLEGVDHEGLAVVADQRRRRCWGGSTRR